MTWNRRPRLAFQKPERYGDVRREGVHVWLATTRALLLRDRVTDPPGRAIATLISGTARGLMLDLLQPTSAPASMPGASDGRPLL
jgi:hypothetical protein